MSTLIEIPMSQLAPATLEALLQEFASRDGTDYGETEMPLADKVHSLQRQLAAGELSILYDSDTESWDLLPKEQAQQLLQDE